MKIVFKRVYVSVCGHVGTNVRLTFLPFDGLSVQPFVCSYTVLLMFLSVCLSTSSNIICIRLTSLTEKYEKIADN